jgi:hypothetical protein
MLMKQLFENEYMEIRTDTIQGILEIDLKKNSDNIKKFDEQIVIINQYVKDTKDKKLILKLNNLYEISKESILKEKFLPFIGEQKVKTVAVITGENMKVKTLISELDSYLASEKEHYDISLNLFETYEQAFQWISSD